MPFKDLDVYLQVVRALLNGQNPYAVPEAYYPLPFYFIFLPLAYLPLPFAHALWTLIEAGSLIAILRTRAIWALFFAPVVLAFLMGQIDLPMLGILALLRGGWYGGIALGLLALKPQLAILILPWQVWQWWRGDRQQIALFMATLLLLGGAAFIVEPQWLGNWLALSGERLRAPLAPSLWGALAFIPPPLYLIVGLAVSVILVAYAYRRGDFAQVTITNFLVNPVIISYDLTLLTLFIRDRRAWIILIFLSWLAFGISAVGWWRGEGPFVLVSAVLLGVSWLRSSHQLDRKLLLPFPLARPREDAKLSPDNVDIQPVR